MEAIIIAAGMVNPYFPPRKLLDEIKANFETLLTQIMLTRYNFV